MARMKLVQVAPLCALLSSMALGTLGIGCGAVQAPDLPPPQKKVQEAPEPEGPRDRIYRSELEGVLRQGPPWILSRIDIEEVIAKGKFVGWRVRDLPYEWRDVDLKAGDVVVAINTLPLETPNHFWSAWTTLGVASEIKVSYLRDGEKRELRYPIDGAPDPKLSKQLGKKQGKDDPAVKGSQRYNRPKRKNTIVIRGEDKSVTDTRVDFQ